MADRIEGDKLPRRLVRVALIWFFLGSLAVRMAPSAARAQTIPEREADGFIGAVKSVHVRTAYLISESEIFSQEIPAIAYTVTYDAAGRSIERADFLPDGSSDTRSTSKYDSDGKEIEHAYYVHDSLVYKTVKTYGTNGGEIQSVDYDASGSVRAKFTSTYKHQGRLRETKELDGGKGLKRRLLFKLDSKNRITERREYEVKSSLRDKTVYAHDSKGNKTEETHSYKSNGTWRNSKDTYSYDPKGRLLEEAVYLDGILSSRETRKYDKSGNLIENIKYDAKGIITEIANWSYERFDSRGNWVKAIIEIRSKESPHGSRQTMAAYREITYFDSHSVAAGRIE